MEQQKQTVGEFRVRVAFNPSNNSGVDAVKQGGASLINIILESKEFPEGGIERENREWMAREHAMVMANVIGERSPGQYLHPEEFIRLRALALKSLRRVCEMVSYNADESAIEAEVATSWAVKTLTCEIMPMKAPVTEVKAEQTSN